MTAMLDIALYEADKPVTLAGISERQSISLSYLEQLFSRLRRQGRLPVCVAQVADTVWLKHIMRFQYLTSSPPWMS